MNPRILKAFLRFSWWLLMDMFAMPAGAANTRVSITNFSPLEQRTATSANQ